MCVNCQNCEAVGKLFADLWKRLVFFHQVVNGFSISTSGSFPYFHDARKSSNDQPVHRQRHIPYRHNHRHARTKPPITPPIIKFSTNRAIPPPREPPPGTIQRHIRWSPNGRSTEYPEPYIVKLSVLHAGGFEDTIQDQRHDYGQYAFEEKCFDCFASCHR